MMNPVTLINVLNPAEADLICCGLRGAGFHPFLPDEVSATNMEGYALSIGGIRIQVPSSEYLEAKDFLAATDAH